jgi:cyclophilin family peptidyl-prolyl cis-trans isomerase
MSDPQEPAPPPAPNPSPSASSARPGVVIAVIAGLLVLIVGGGFLVSSLMRGGPSGPKPQVVIETSEGPITVELFEGESPITVENFLKYVDKKHYDGTIFHRVIPNFMVQGGGFEPGMKQKLPPTRQGIKNEAGNGLKNERGTLAMARTDNPDSATDQFFINLKDNDLLDRPRAPDRVGYAVFGRVIQGMDVVDRIADVQTETRPDPRGFGEHKDVPVKDVLIKSLRRVQTK